MNGTPFFTCRLSWAFVRGKHGFVRSWLSLHFWLIQCPFENNTDRGPCHAINPRIGDVPASRIQVKIANAAFDERAGRYELAPNIVLELSREGDRFFAQPTGQRKRKIFASGDHTFFANAVDAELRFEPSPAGVPNGLVMSQGGHDMKGRKLN